MDSEECLGKFFGVTNQCISLLLASEIGNYLHP